MPGTRKSPHPLRRMQQKLRSREMRKHPTPAERILWQHLRKKQLGVRFRRQHSIDRYIVDFYCAAAALVIEVDGSIHAEPGNDALRQEFLEAHGLRVLRVTNHAIITDLPAVLDRIRAASAPHA